MPLSVKPILQAIVLADHVYIDSRTGKKVIAGTFNRLAARRFPGRFAHTTYAFLALTDLHGPLRLDLRFVDLSDNNVLMEIANLELEAPGDPLATVEMVVHVPRFPLPHPGVYAFEAHAGGELLGAKRLYAIADDHDDEPASDD